MGLISVYYAARANNGVMKACFITLPKCVKHLIMRAMVYRCRGITVKKHIILFEGRPDYSDNPRALCDYLVCNGYILKYKIYYIVEDIDKYISLYSDAKITFLKAKNKWGITPYKTLQVAYSASVSFASHSFLQPAEDYKQGQQHILLWHGCSYKGPSSANDGIRFFDKALVPGPLFVESKCRFWNTTQDYIISKGYPRYDWLLSSSDGAKHFIGKLKQKYHAQKIVIWMPTFRNSIVRISYGENILNQFSIMKDDKSWRVLDKHCQSCSILLIVKLHMSQKDVGINFSELNNILQISNSEIDENYCNLYEFLSCTDALVSDYSSVAIDYLLLNRPIGFVLDDYDAYKTARGFIFDEPKKYMPGNHILSLLDFMDFITDIHQGYDRYAAKRKAISELAIYKSDNYCKSIVKTLCL